MRFTVRLQKQILIIYIKRFELSYSAYSVLFTNELPNKFWNREVFMFEQNFRNSHKKYFLARTVSKLAQFTPFASINIPSKRELLIMSAKFLPLSCASIYKSSLAQLCLDHRYLYRDQFIKVRVLKPNFQEWRRLHSLSPLQNFSSNYSVQNFCSRSFSCNELAITTE